MASQRDVKNKIASVKNIQKITRAMEMVAAARLRRAEQRIAALRPYADAIGRMTRQAAQAAGGEAARVPLLREHGSQENVGLLLVTGDRGLAGGFNSQIIRAGVRFSAEMTEAGTEQQLVCDRAAAASPRWPSAGTSSAAATPASPIDRPTRTRARSPTTLIQAYVDGRLDRVEMVYNSYVSPLTQNVTHQTLLPLTQQAIAGERTPLAGADGRRPRRRSGLPSTTSRTPSRSSGVSCRTTSRSRSTARSSSPRPASSGRR